MIKIKSSDEAKLHLVELIQEIHQVDFQIKKLLQLKYNKIIDSESLNPQISEQFGLFTTHVHTLKALIDDKFYSRALLKLKLEGIAGIEVISLYV